MEEGIELMQRGRARERSAESSVTERTFIERKIKPGDTLNKIALQYSVNVADLRRINNLLNDQDFLARCSVRIPMSKLRLGLRLGIDSESDGDTDATVEMDERKQLLDPHESNVETLFNQTDLNLQQARESLGEDISTHGSFHFLDARPPQATHTPIWLLLLAVLFVFVVLPLFITIYEETEEISPNHTHYHNGIPHHSN
ncbi:lmd-1 [Pristionchus pacificus]|uniref:LysM domain-containing protein n=1 Tax=Pristionchus pacificus TaxID=54126 RepID=A0A8R1Z7E0_PRIPA|nr:lmd-1 [Pristionchus pacificus]